MAPTLCVSLRPLIKLSVVSDCEFHQSGLVPRVFGSVAARLTCHIPTTISKLITYLGSGLVCKIEDTHRVASVWVVLKDTPKWATSTMTCRPGLPTNYLGPVACLGCHARYPLAAIKSIVGNQGIHRRPSLMFFPLSGPRVTRSCLTPPAMRRKPLRLGHAWARKVSLA